MALKSLQCPHCSARVDIFDESTHRGFCPFCGVAIDNIQHHQALFAGQANSASSARQSSCAQDADFEIVGAILRRYRGSGTEVVVPRGVLAIGKEAFADCSFITSVTLPDTLKEIHVSAFRACTRLTKVYLGTGVESIGPSAFANCSSLSSIVIPRSCKTIDYNAFEGCKALSSVTLPKELEVIGDNAFSSTAIRGIKLPPAPLTLGSNVFYDCPMEWAVVPKGTRMVNKFQLGIVDPFNIKALTQQGTSLDPGGLAATLAGFNPGLEAQPSRLRIIIFACEEDREAYDKAIIQKLVREAEKHLDSKRVELMKEIDRLGLGQRAKKKALRERLDKAYISNDTLRSYYPELRLMKPASMGKYLADNSEYMQTGRKAQVDQTPASAQVGASQASTSQPSNQESSEGAQARSTAFTDYDFTDYIYDMLVNTFIEDHGIDLRENTFATKRLKLAAKSAAESFSACGEAEVEVENVAEVNGSWLSMNYHIGSSS